MTDTDRDPDDVELDPVPAEDADVAEDETPGVVPPPD